jgi:prepilin-type processing-associated H-X9-DG protein
MEDRRRLTLPDWIGIAVVVVLFLATVTWLLFRPRERDGHGNCLSNVKQIGLAMHMYANDNDNRFPRGHYQQGGQDVSWEVAIQPYLKNWLLFVCPNQRRLPGRYPLAPATHPFGYGVNRTYLFPPAPAPTVSWSQIASPQETIVVADRSLRRWDIYAPIKGGGAAADPPCNVAARHEEGAAFLFADGHVEYMKADDAWSKDDTLWDLR